MTFHLSTSAEILHALGVRLREQRLAQTLTQRELAQMAGLSLGALRKLRKQRPVLAGNADPRRAGARAIGGAG